MIDEISEFNYQFRQKIRKKRIQDLFTAKRKQLMKCQHGTNEQTIMDGSKFTQFCRHICQPQSCLNMSLLMQIGRYCNHPQAITAVQQTNLIQKLITYFRNCDNQSKQQQLCSVILNNLTALPTSALQSKLFLVKDFIDHLFTIANLASGVIQESCLGIIFNIIYDYNHEIIVSNLCWSDSIVGRVIQILQITQSTSVYVECMKIYLLLVKKIHQSPYLMLSQIKNVIYKRINHFWDLHSYNVNLLCLQKVIKLSQQKTIKNQFLQGMLLNPSLIGNQITIKLKNSIIHLVMDTIQQMQIKSCVLPYLYKVMVNFKQNSSIMQQSYCLLYEIIKLNRIYGVYIANEGLQFLQFLVTEFEISHNNAIISSLSLSMGVLLLQAETYISITIQKRIKDRLNTILIDGTLDQINTTFLSQIMSCCQ